MDWNILLEEIIILVSEHRNLLQGLALGSLGFFLLTPVLAPAFIILIPKDALVRNRANPSDLHILRRIGRILFHIIKDIVGVILMLVGFVLLFIPGQGLLTIFIGLMITDLPGKRNLLARLLGAGKIRPVVDRLRKKYRREPLLWPGESAR